MYLPPGYAKGRPRYPVVYFLHSINWDNERMFAPGTGAQPTFDRAIANGVIRPFIVVAPDYTTPGPGSLFANSSTAGRFEDHTLKEVIPFIDANYRTLARAESRAITGDFMGAYGALRYAFRHPDVFSVVYGMHPVGTGSGVEPCSAPRLGAAAKRAHAGGSAARFFGPVFLAMIQTFLPNPERPPFYCDFMVDVRDGARSVNVDNVRRVENGFFLENIAAQERDKLPGCAASSSTGDATIPPMRTCTRTGSSRATWTNWASITRPRNIAARPGTSTGAKRGGCTPKCCRSSRGGWSGKWGLTPLLVDADVVDFHGHREDGVVDTHLSAPVAADRDVEDQELRTVEGPLGIARAVVRILVVVAVVDADGDARFAVQCSW